MSGDANFSAFIFLQICMATREMPLLQNTSANIFMVFPSAARETRQK
jgi:hypothetical protein